MHQDVVDIVKNIEKVYDSNTSFQILKDFERVLDELDMYVYKNWADGELAAGPEIERHWVTCKFFWPLERMPDPMGGKRLLDYDCKVSYEKTYLVKPRKIREPSDIRPGTKKGKLDRQPIWIVTIRMPKSLIIDIFTGYQEQRDMDLEPATQEINAPEQDQTADNAAEQPAGDAAEQPAGDAASAEGVI